MSPRSQNVSKNVSKIYTRTTNLRTRLETPTSKPSRKCANLELLENQYIQGQNISLKECLLKP